MYYALPLVHLSVTDRRLFSAALVSRLDSGLLAGGNVDGDISLHLFAVESAVIKF